MDGQLSFATMDYAGKKKRTKRDAFLAEMAAAVPWSVLEAVIAPHYPKEGPQGGRRAFPIAVMLRIYCLQQWYNLSDPGACWRSQTCISPAGHLRPPDDPGHPLPARRCELPALTRKTFA